MTAHDTQAIRDALVLLTEPGQILELRVPSVGGRSNNTASGYFDDLEKAAQAAARYNGRDTVYMTLHKVDPALFARAANRMKEYAKATTADANILARHWLLIDADATRPADISSTDEEHELALARTQLIRDFLRQRGWPEPFYADSGNGGHLLYPVDLPADDGGLTQRVLAAVAALFDDRLVKVDRTVYNPARISKVYGTFACKGDNIPDRPHRLARIIDAPADLRPVPLELLEQLATPAEHVAGPKSASGQPRAGTRTAQAFDVEGYLREHGIGFTGPVDYDGGKKWHLDACVWNGHNDKSAIVIRRADGVLCANCNHNSCEGLGWPDLREALEPGYKAAKEERERAYQARQQQTRPDVDPETGEIRQDRPRINAGDNDIPAVADLAWTALLAANEPPALFRYASGMARMEMEEGRAVMRPLTEHRLRHELGRDANWYKETKTGAVPADVPLRVVEDMLAHPNPPLPILERIVHAPFFALDGRLIIAPGYDKGSRTLLLLDNGLNIPLVPDAPTAKDVQRARDLILDNLLGDFPFVDQADRANAIAAMLLSPARLMITGPTPIHLFEAASAGSGKGLCVDVVTRPFVGAHVGVISGASQDDEWRKRITAKLREGAAVILADNITTTIDSGALASAVTADVWTDRLLGTNETMSVPVRCHWLMTANNPTMTTEIARRTIRIRIDPKQDRPWQRTGFRHENLIAWTEEHRADLVHAALVLIQAWIAAGKPKGTVTLGSFERWATVMGGILDNAGITAFLDNLNEFYEAADTEGAVWRQFVAVWWAQHRDAEVGVKGLFDLTDQVEGFDLGKGTDKALRTTFGKQLGKQRDRVIGEYRIVFARVAHKTNMWRLLPTTIKPLFSPAESDEDATDEKRPPPVFLCHTNGDEEGGGHRGTFKPSTHIEKENSLNTSVGHERQNVPRCPPCPPDASPSGLVPMSRLEMEAWAKDIASDWGSSPDNLAGAKAAALMHLHLTIPADAMEMMTADLILAAMKGGR